MIDIKPTDEKLIQIMESMLASLFSWIQGENLIRCFLSVVYFHEDCREHLARQCFKGDNVDPHSHLLLSAVDLYITVYRLIAGIARKSMILEVPIPLPFHIER